jgi:hypothetical protein
MKQRRFENWKRQRDANKTHSKPKISPIAILRLNLGTAPTFCDMKERKTWKKERHERKKDMKECKIAIFFLPASQVNQIQQIFISFGRQLQVGISHKTLCFWRIVIKRVTYLNCEHLPKQIFNLWQHVVNLSEYGCTGRHCLVHLVRHIGFFTRETRH